MREVSKYQHILWGRVSILAIAIMGVATPAFAQDVTDDDGKITEIVVTAQKRSEKLIDVPISITALSGEQLEARGTKNVRDLQFGLPNLTTYTQDNFNPNIIVRGISSGARSLGFESGLGIYIDGVYTGRTASFTQDLDDVERVEVLRGPQGTLFGKNTTVGAISITTRRPDNDFQGSVSGEYGNFDHYRVTGGLSGPLAKDRVYAKLSGYVDARDGYIRNISTVGKSDINNDEGAGVRGELRFTPSNALDISIRGDWSRAKRNELENETALIDPVTGNPNGIPIDSEVPGINTINIDGAGRSVRDLYGTSLALNYTTGSGHVITVISAYRKFDSKLLALDVDNSSFDYLTTDFLDKTSQFSQELRVASPDDGRFKYVAGVYYFDQKANSDRSTNLGLDTQNLLEFGFGLPNALVTNPSAIRTVNAVKTKAIAAYVNGSFNITDELSFLFGARYTNEKKRLRTTQTAPGVFSTPGLFQPDPIFLDVAPASDRISDNDFSPTLGLSYQPSDNATIYVKYSKGFKSGGWNAELLAPTVAGPQYFDVANIRFKSENISNYEIGVKTQLADRRLTINAAVFQLVYSDIQIPRFVGGLAGFQTDNAGKARSRGFEVEINARPTPGFDLGASFGYSNAKYTSYKDGCGAGCDLDGVALDAPRFTMGLSAQYAYPVSDSMKLVLRSDYAYRGKAPGNGDTPERLLSSRPGFGTFDARISLEGDAGWGVTLWAKNLFDKDYIVDRGENTNLALFGVTQQYSSYGPPRTYGVRLGYRF